MKMKKFYLETLETIVVRRTRVLHAYDKDDICGNAQIRQAQIIFQYPQGEEDIQLVDVVEDSSYKAL